MPSVSFIFIFIGIYRFHSLDNSQQVIVNVTDWSQLITKLLKTNHCCKEVTLSTTRNLFKFVQTPTHVTHVEIPTVRCSNVQHSCFISHLTVAMALVHVYPATTTSRPQVIMTTTCGHSRYVH